MIYALDASAILAVIFDETGAQRVRATFADAIISTVNLSEVASKLLDKGADEDVIRTWIGFFADRVHAFDAAQAIDAGLLRKTTRTPGLSLGDRACLALARANNATVVTADRAWAKLNVDVDIELIR